MRKTKYLAIAIAIIVSLPQCKKLVSKNDLFNNYDQVALLNNLGNNVLVPGIDSFSSSASAAQTAINSFIANPDTATLSSAQNAFAQMAIKWAVVEPFNFGPMTDNLWAQTINTWPIDTTKIQTAVNTQASATGQGADAKGLKALEYLLYDHNGNQAVVAKYSTGTSAANMKLYLASVINSVTSVATAFQTSWVGSGNYISTFTTAKGNYVSSSVSLLINSISFFLDQAKNAKVGNPIGMGVKVNDGLAHPDLIEYPIAELSLPVLNANVQSMETLFNGGTNGPGIKDLLDYVKAQQSGQNLSMVIDGEYTDAVNKINVITPPYATATSTQTQSIKNVYVALKLLIANTEVNAANDLGISITFTDNDGD